MSVKTNLRRLVPWMGAVIVIITIAGVVQAYRLNRASVTQDLLYLGYTELTYCSEQDDSSCQSNVMRLDYIVDGQNEALANLYSYDAPKKFGVKIDEVELTLNKSLKSSLGDDVCIYADSNNDEVYDDRDVLLSCSTNSKKTARFESINRKATSNKVGPLQRVQETFFIVDADGSSFADFVEVDEEGAPVTKKLVKRITAKTNNLSDKNRVIEHRGSFADKSTYRYANLISSTQQEFLSRNPQFSALGAEGLSLSGDVTFSETVVVPRGTSLTVEAGTNIQIAEEASFVSYSPVDYSGTQSKPVTISTIEGQGNFGSVAMIGSVGSSDSSTISYLNVDGGSEDTVNGAYLSGMFSIYRFDEIKISDSSFNGSASDDGLNIKYGEVDLSRNTFLNNSADAFDGDFVTGDLTDNEFVDNGNDSLDFSGSTVQIYNNVIRSSGDKCISVGERTEASIYRNLLSGCAIGVQTKDASESEIYENVIEDSKLSGLNAYIKKDFFGAPSVSYRSNYINGKSEAVTGLVPVSEFDQGQNFTTLPVDTDPNLQWVSEILEKREVNDGR